MSSDPQTISRRGFAKAAATAAVLAPLAACATGQPEPAAGPAPAAPGTPAAPVAPSSGGAQPAAAQPDPVVDALVDVIRARYGTRIDDEQMRAVRDGVRGNLGLARTLRQFPIPIAVEPASVFRVYRAGGR
jgi:hypothetical protein